ncbi:hypothetical protein TNCV_2149351 [Trichonephila clavipes]|nr:hypothetical protein TNCV_2149351 [Trichonephila clavipes]
MFTKAYGNETLSEARVFEWHTQISGRRDSAKDSESAESPAITDPNIAKFRDVIRGDRRLSVRAVVELINLDREAVRRKN